MNIDILIRQGVLKSIQTIFNSEINIEDIQIQFTRKEFEGDLTVVIFPYTRFSKKNPEQTGTDIGEFLLKNVEVISKFNVVNGFLNLLISSSYWVKEFQDALQDSQFGLKKIEPDSPLAMVEYSSPNTNKPLHLGHIRNNLLGYSIAEVLKANGKRVIKTNIVNDRGVHICKSMYAWLKEGKNETPENSGKKGDHLVGEYYVKFDQLYKSEISELVQQGMSKEEAENKVPSMVAIRDMLLKWESNDSEVRKLWETMNGWVYEGFDVTYKKLGVDFDKIYYESETYTIGRDEVLRGVSEGIFEKHDDCSVWANLEKDGLDQKILLRSDGTSVYMTQDIGTAKLRYEDYHINQMVYVVGNEQIYHFQVLSVLLDKLGYEWGKDLYHFSYGMVELPQGKMKSREGTVVDADDLINEMVEVARKTSEELGKLDGYDETEREEIYSLIALGALKYFILKVDPRKTMMFNPEESIDFNGNTGPFIQYTYARIQSVLRNAKVMNLNWNKTVQNILPEIKVIELIKKIILFPDTVNEAGQTYSPALIANYCYDLVKEFNQFYHEFSILGEPNENQKIFRLQLAEMTGRVIYRGMGMLGIKCPERM